MNNLTLNNKRLHLQILSIIIAIQMLLFSGCTAPDKSSTNETTTKKQEEWSVSSATWLNLNNIVLQWDNTYTSYYKIYRLNDKNEYDYIGESESGSFRDSSVTYPNKYTYKVEKIFVTEQNGVMSNPIVSGTNPQKLTSVPVIMYHNFITPQDEANGIEYEEYSIRPEDFEADLIWLKDNGYTTITSRELVDYLSEHPEKMPEKPIIISIDDGTWGVYTNAWPILKKHKMKADLNVIGENIDATWDKLNSGKTRKGESAPYCTWEELVKMSDSGEINVCSHTYGLHVYDRNGRIGMDMMDGESEEDYKNAVVRDYELSQSCIGGWVKIDPITVAYPYSKRNNKCDEIILNNTGYKVLMCGSECLGTLGNYFITGCDIDSQLMIMSRPCRMDGTSISKYVEKIETEQKTLFSTKKDKKTTDK